MYESIRSCSSPKHLLVVLNGLEPLKEQLMLKLLDECFRTLVYIFRRRLSFQLLCRWHNRLLHGGVRRLLWGDGGGGLRRSAFPQIHNWNLASILFDGGLLAAPIVLMMRSHWVRVLLHNRFFLFYFCCDEIEVKPRSEFIVTKVEAVTRWIIFYYYNNLFWVSMIDWKLDGNVIWLEIYKILHGHANTWG